MPCSSCSAARRCLVRLVEIDPDAGAACGESLARHDYDKQGKPEICWASATERAALINELFSDAVRVIEACSDIDDAVLRAEVELLRVVSDVSRP